MTLPSRSSATAESGFTFVGMILIIFSMALFTSAFFLALPPSESTKNSALTSQRGLLIQGALKKFKIQNEGAAPASLSELVTTTGTLCRVDTDSSSSTYRQLKGWCGPYLDSIRIGSYEVDGWGVNFHYNGINLTSCGPDRTCGSGDDIVFNDF